MDGGITRFTAAKATISQIISGEYIKEDETGFSGILTNNKEKIRRVNVMGIIIEIENDNNYTIDDGTDKISIRSFDEIKKRFNIGDAVNIIGKPREFGSRYILIEIIKEIDKRWINIRKVELSTKNTGQKKEQIIELVKRLDAGEGANFEEIIKDNKDESIIRKLIETGELFEFKPGRLKAL